MKHFLRDNASLIAILVFFLVLLGLTFAQTWHSDALYHERVTKALEHGCPTED